MSKSSRADSKISALYRQNGSLLRRFLSRFLVRPQDIEDVVQETFLRAYHAEQSTEIRSPKAFLFRIARNLALTELSAKSRQITSYTEEVGSAASLDVVASTEEQLLAEEQLAMFCKAVASLPQQCRWAFFMRKVYGMSHQEIARELNISTSTVEKHLAAGLSRCNEYLQARGFEPARRRAAGGGRE